MRTQFNDGWSYRSKATVFQEIGGAGGQWQEVQLPHDALITTERTADAKAGETSGYFEGGAFEYRRTLEIPADSKGNYIALEFDGVYREASVYVNGALAGQDAFGYSRFTVRIDPYLKFGQPNEIRVDCRAHLDSRWYTGAGIYRAVHLVENQGVHIAADGVRVTTLEADREWATVEVATTVANLTGATETAHLTTIIRSADGEEVVRDSRVATVLPQDSALARQRILVPNPALWSVEDPNLYTVETLLTAGAGEVEVGDAEFADSVTTTFGIRTIQVDPARGLRINGEPVKLRGACIHHDNGPLGAATFPDAEERRVRILKEAGFNSIRSAHNPASTALLEACDRLGMLVMDEAFDMWTQPKSAFDYSFEFPTWWEKDIEAMVRKDINHPSVIFYSIGNEIPETGDKFGGIWSRRLAEKVRELDPTRLVTNGVNGFVSVLDMVLEGRKRAAEAAAKAAAEAAASGGGSGDGGAEGGVNTMMGAIGPMMNQIQTSPQATERTAESYAALDVAGMNYSAGRYEMDLELFPQRIIVGTETWPGDIDVNWDLVKKHPHVLGDYTWTGWDYLGEVGIGVPRYMDPNAQGVRGFDVGFPGLTSFTGDIDITGTRRPVSYYRETVFGLRTSPYIAVLRPEHYGKMFIEASPWAWHDVVSSWSWPGAEGKTVSVEVYSDAEEVELLLNGSPVGRAKVGETRAFRADFDVVYQPGELVAVAYRDGVETGRSLLRSASDRVQLALEVESADLSAGQLAYVRIRRVDENGELHIIGDEPVTLTLDGPAVLQGFGSGNPSTVETFGSLTHSTFDGQVLAILRVTGTGEIRVGASSAGAESAAAVIRVS